MITPTREELLKLSLSDFRLVQPTPEDILSWFSILEAGWVHNGDPTKPHAKLHSGKCSTGYFLVKKVLKYGNLREILAAAIIAELKGKFQLCISDITAVFGAPYSSINLAADVGRLLGVPNYVPEKDSSDPLGKKMIFKPDDPIPEGSVLFQVEDLITTLDSATATKSAVISGNPYPVRFFPAIGTVIYRPPEILNRVVDDTVILPLVAKQVSAWDPAICPLCKKGSIPLPPKGENWAKLTA